MPHDVLHHRLAAHRRDQLQAIVLRLVEFDPKLESVVNLPLPTEEQADILAALGDAAQAEAERSLCSGDAWRRAAEAVVVELEQTHPLVVVAIYPRLIVLHDAHGTKPSKMRAEMFRERVRVLDR